jgi:quinohemoprotein ethanol dehydrogenase
MATISRAFKLVALIILAVGHVRMSAAAAQSRADAAGLRDSSNGENWSAYGRTYGEQHYSPLEQMNADNIDRLGLAWSMDLGRNNPVTVPLEIDGVLYFASGYSVIHAVNAVNGRLLWTYDPDVPKAAGHKLRSGFGSRGIGYWNGKIYSGTGDGRLIAVDAKSGKLSWSVLTVVKDDGRFITGAPRLFDGKVIIGHGGSDSSATRDYVTTYDARTGKQVWRFFIVPGKPAAGVPDKAQEMAAKTWAGPWWKYGGGGAAWNAFAYDPDTDTVFVGTGGGAPWNRRIRSADSGDNLFLCSIVALDAKTGVYKWHYQTNPGDSWDYDATMDMQLADLTIGGKQRKVLLQASKNGFLYVIDRIDGKLISAEKFAKATWATSIDQVTGRPVEVPGARYPDGHDFELWPSMLGAHSWMPSAYSPKSRLIYIPSLEKGAVYNDRGITVANWSRAPADTQDWAVNVSLETKDPLDGTGWLLAIDPATQTLKWKLPRSSVFSGGILATAGNLVFQGQTTGDFDAYAADTGRSLWRFAAQAPVIAAPISYSVNGKQYVTVLVGNGTAPGALGSWLPKPVDARTQAKRVLTFALDAAGTLPPALPANLTAPSDPDYSPDQALINTGAIDFARHCSSCHGMAMVAGGVAPDLRSSFVPTSAQAFENVVRGGALLQNGMPRFDEFDDATLAAIREYIRSQADVLRKKN